MRRYNRSAVLATILLDILAPILLMVGAGALLRWRFAVDVQTLSKVTVYLFTPAFIFSRVSRSRLLWSEMAGIVGVTVTLVLLMGLVAWIGCRIARVKRKTLAAVAMAVMFYNSGNFGLPLAELTFPPPRPTAAVVVNPAATRDGAASQTFVVLTQNVLTYTLGLAIAAGASSSGYRQIARKMLSLPVLYTLAAALLARVAWPPDGVREMPKVIRATADFLAGGLVPLALITLGAQLARSPRWPAWKPVSFVLVVRLLLGPALMTALLWALHVSLPNTWLDLWPWPAQSLILTAGVPTAINTLLLTLELKGDPELTADCVFWTTVFSAGTVLLWLVVLQHAF